MPRYTEEQKRLMSDLYLDGQNITRISARFDCAPNTVLRALKTYSDEYNHKKNLPVEEIVKKYGKGMSRRALSQEYRVGYELIVRLLSEAGVEVRAPGEQQRKHHFNERFFESIDSEDKAYWLGFFFADGSVSSTRKDSTIVVARKDREICEKFLQSIEYVGATNAGIKDYSATTGYGLSEFSKVCLHSDKMWYDLVSHGVVPNKTFVAAAPIGLPVEFIRHFIRGLSDGDGGIYVYPNGSSSWELVGAPELLQWVADNLPTTYSHNLERHKSIFRVRSRTKDVYEIVQWLYEDNPSVYLTRKYDRAMQVISRGKRKDTRNKTKGKESLVLDMNSQGESVTKIAATIGSDHYTIKKVIESAGAIPNLALRYDGQECSHDGCTNPRHGKYCYMHYERDRKGQDMDAPLSGVMG